MTSPARKPDTFCGCVRNKKYYAKSASNWKIQPAIIAAIQLWEVEGNMTWHRGCGAAELDVFSPSSHGLGNVEELFAEYYAWERSGIAKHFKLSVADNEKKQQLTKLRRAEFPKDSSKTFYRPFDTNAYNVWRFGWIDAYDPINLGDDEYSRRLEQEGMVNYGIKFKINPIVQEMPNIKQSLRHNNEFNVEMTAQSIRRHMSSLEKYMFQYPASYGIIKTKIDAEGDMKTDLDLTKFDLDMKDLIKYDFSKKKMNGEYYLWLIHYIYFNADWSNRTAILNMRKSDFIYKSKFGYSVSYGEMINKMTEKYIKVVEHWRTSIDPEGTGMPMRKIYDAKHR